MNANACNYDMAATLHDAESCSFIFNHTLEGDSDVTLEEATSYSYAFNAGSEYIWEVEGGVIVDGQGSHQVSVMWLLEEGVISVREVNAEGCEGEVSSLIVTGNATNIVEGTAGFTAFPNPVHGTLYVNAIGHGKPPNLGCRGRVCSVSVWLKVKTPSMFLALRAALISWS